MDDPDFLQRIDACRAGSNDLYDESLALVEELAADPHKRELFDAVFARRAEILNGARAEAMRAYQAAHPGDMTAEGVIEAFIGPLLDYSMSGEEGWKNYFRLVALVNNTPAWGGETMHRFFDPVVHQLVDTLKVALPKAEMRDLYWGYQFLTGAMMLTLSETGRIDQLSDGLCRSTDRT